MDNWLPLKKKLDSLILILGVAMHMQIKARWVLAASVLVLFGCDSHNPTAVVSEDVAPPSLDAQAAGAPDIQAAVLLGHVEPRDRHLREVGRHPLWTDQRRVFDQLFPNVPK